MRASSDQTIHEIQTGLGGMALIGSRAFNVDRTTARAGFSQYMLLDRAQSGELIAGGLGRALRYDGYMSADEFLALDRPQAADIAQLGLQPLELPAEAGRSLSKDAVDAHKDLFAALLADLWSAFYSRFERAGVCLFPVGAAVEGDADTFWDNAGALVNFIAAHMPKAAMQLFSVTAGGTWREHGRQSGSAFYICRGGEQMSGSGCYDLTHFSAEPRERGALLQLGRALLNGEDIRFYRRMESLSNEEYGRGPGRLCLDPQIAAELYRIQRLFDDKEAVERLIQAWIGLENILNRSIKRNMLTRAESVRILEPIVREALTRLNNADSAAAQSAYSPAARYLMQARAENAGIDETLEADLRAFLIGMETVNTAAPQKARLSGLEAFFQEIEADERLLEGQGGTELIALVIGWLKRHRISNLPTHAEAEKICRLAAGERAFAAGLRSELCGYAADVLERLNGAPREVGAERMKTLLPLLNDSGIELAGETGTMLCTVLRKRLAEWYSRETLPLDMLDRLIALGGNGEACSGWGAAVDQLKNALDNNCAETLDAGIGKTLSRLPAGKAAGVKESLSRWLRRRNLERTLSTDERKVLYALKTRRPELKIDELICGMVHDRLEQGGEGQLAELALLMKDVQEPGAYNAQEVGDYLRQVYAEGQRDLSEADEETVPFWTAAQGQIHAFAIKRLSFCSDMKTARQCIKLLQGVGVRAREADVLFGFLERVRKGNDGVDEKSTLTTACKLLKSGNAAAEEQWISYLKAGLRGSGADSRAIDNCLHVCQEGGITADALKKLVDDVVECADRGTEGTRDSREEALCRFVKQCSDAAEKAARCLARHEMKQSSRKTLERMKSMRQCHKLGLVPGQDEIGEWYNCRVKWAAGEYLQAYANDLASDSTMELSIVRVKSGLEQAAGQRDYHLDALAHAFYDAGYAEQGSTLESRLLDKANTFADVKKVKDCREMVLRIAKIEPNDRAEQRLIQFADQYGEMARASEETLLNCFSALNNLDEIYRPVAVRMVKAQGKPDAESPWPRVLLYTLRDDGGADWGAYFSELYPMISDDGDWTAAQEALSGHDLQKALNTLSWLRWQINRFEKLKTRKAEVKGLRESFEKYAGGLAVCEASRKLFGEEWAEGLVNKIREWKNK